MYLVRNCPFNHLSLLHVQVVSGQLEGTVFDKKAAKALEKEEEDVVQGRSPRAASGKDNARDAAQAARTASRVLQSLSSQVIHIIHQFWITSSRLHRSQCIVN